MPENTVDTGIRGAFDGTAPLGEPEPVADADAGRGLLAPGEGRDAPPQAGEVPAEKPADDDAGGEIDAGLILEAGRAGLTMADIEELGSTNAVLAAIRLANRRAGAQEARAAERSVAAEKQPDDDWPVVNLKDTDYDKELVSAVEGLSGAAKKRILALAAETGGLKKEVAELKAHVEGQARQAWTSTVDTVVSQFVAQNPEWKDTLGQDGELTPAQLRARSTVADELVTFMESDAKKGRNRHPKTHIGSAVAAAFGEKQRQYQAAQKAAQVDARSKVQLPGGAVRSSGNDGDPAERAAEILEKGLKARGLDKPQAVSRKWLGGGLFKRK